MAEWILGVGTLTIGGVSAGKLQSGVSYTEDCEFVEGYQGKSAGGPRVCVERVLTKVGATLKAETATLSTAVLAKLLLGSSPAGTLTGYAVTYVRAETGYPTMTITFASAHVIPTGTIQMQQDGWTTCGIEIRSVGTTLPTVVMT